MLFLISLIFFANVNFALASANTTIIDPNNKKYDTGDYELDDVVIVGINITKIILGVVGSLALLMFIYGGVMMLISSGNSDQVTKAKGILMAAVIGLAIVFASYTIIQFVMGTLGVTWKGDSSAITNTTTK